MRVGIICAMEEEVGMLAEFIPDRTVIRMGMRDYYSGTLWGVPVVLVYSRMGKVAAAATTTNMILEFDIAEIIFIGVAGSSSQNINIGDIVIGKSLYQHDLDASPIFIKHEIPLLQKTYIDTSEIKRKVFADICQQFTQRIEDHIHKNVLKDFNIISPKAVIGDIASGDRFISAKEELQSIKEALPSVLCVEMEGAALGQVCFEYDVPFSVIRIISDTADENAHVDFEKFVEQIASIYSFEILKRYFNQLN
ncbi:MAG: 5'-methylthioadenosine/adenosylhomocysteine nucleosidase [Deltaproteobacteria bacterium]